MSDNLDSVKWYEKGVHCFFSYPEEVKCATNLKRDDNIYATCPPCRRQYSTWLSNPANLVRHLEVTNMRSCILFIFNLN